MEKKAVILGSSGSVGRYMVNFFYEMGYEILGVDKVLIKNNRVKKQCPYDLNDINLVSKGIFNDCSAIIFAIPYQLAKNLIDEVLQSIKNQNLLIIDTFSAKYQYFAQLDSYRNSFQTNLYFLSMTPLFSPNKELSSYKTLVGSYKNNLPDAEIVDFIKSHPDMIFMDDITQYDVIMSYIQVIPHCLTIMLATLLKDSEICYSDIKKYSTGFMEMMFYPLSRIVSGMPHVYWEIQQYNPYAKKARKKIRSSLSLIDKLLNSKDINNFEAYFNYLKNYFNDSDDINQSFSRMLNHSVNLLKNKE